uniref:hypothetical protein n=1 Tax=Lachnoclostridium phocaeense TaxID=1871021 RepID=UPI0026DBCFAD|nr:hypothetical protein [Lachnoclostridium phocaeense]
MGTTIDDLYRSIVRELLYHVDPATDDSAVEIYTVWRLRTRYTIKNPAIAATILEYIEAMKGCDRRLLLVTAKMDGYVTYREAEQLGSILSGKEHGNGEKGEQDKRS